MDKKIIEILAIGAHEKILATVLRLINAHDEWSASGAGSGKEAIAFFKQKTFDLVLLGGGISEEKELKEELKLLNPNIICVDHFGGGSGLLKSEILQALQTGKI